MSTPVLFVSNTLDPVTPLGEYVSHHPAISLYISIYGLLTIRLVPMLCPLCLKSLLY